MYRTLLTATLHLLCSLTACAAPATAPSHLTSDWGSEFHGLQVRIESPSEVEENAPLTVRFEFRGNAARLSKGVNRLDTFLFPAWTQLLLKNVRTGKELRVVPFDPSLGMPVADDGTCFAALDGRASAPLEISFPLRSIGDALEAGDYDAFVSYASNRIRKHWVARRPAQGFWSGEVRSAPIRLHVAPERVRVRSVRVPMRLRLDANLIVVFKAQDARELRIPVRNGTFFGTRITRSDGPEQLRSDLLAPDSIDPVDDWGILPPRNGNATYTIELFETALPPQHMWMPTPQSKDYRTLWTGTFVVSQEN